MKKNTIPFIAGFVALAVIMTLVFLGSCATNRHPQLTVEISQPKTGDTFYLSRQVFINASISGKETWSRVELWANKLMVQSATAAQVQSDTPIIPWTPIDLGPTMLEVRAYNRSGKDYVSAKVAVTILEAPLATTPDPSPAANEPTPTVPATKENCTVAATLLADLSIPSGTELKAGQSFTKSWRVHNNGSCDWVNYKLVYISGSLMGGNSPSALRTVKSGEIIDIAIELIAPNYPGGYNGLWKIQTDTGSLLETELRFNIVIPTPTPTASPTATKKPTSTPQPTKTPTATAVPPTSTSTSIPTAVVTPSPTAEPTSVPTAEPSPIPAPYTVIVMNPKDIAQGESLELSVSCDSTGGQAVSGGYTLARGVVVQASQRVANGWLIRAVNESDKSQRISIHASCLIDPGLKMDIRADNGIAKANQETELSLSTEGSITGLGYSFGSARALSLLTTETGDTIAKIKVRNTSNQDLPVLIQAISLRQGMYMSRDISPRTTHLLPGETKQIEQSCTSGLAIGATFSNPNLFPVTISRPTLNGWLFEVTNTSTSEADFDSALICFVPDKDSPLPVKSFH